MQTDRVFRRFGWYYMVSLCHIYQELCCKSCWVLSAAGDVSRHIFARAFCVMIGAHKMFSVFVFAAKRSDQVTPPDRALL